MYLFEIIFFLNRSGKYFKILRYVANQIRFLNSFENFRYSVHRNLIGLGTDDSGAMIQINIPEPYWNTTSYRSTLGHKVNHSFVKIKAMFNFATHPRFGWVRTLTAIEDIYQGYMK